MSELTQFKNLGIILEGRTIKTEGNVTFIRTPFRGEVYAVNKEDLVDNVEDEAEEDDTIGGVGLSMQTFVKVEDHRNGISGRTLLMWSLDIKETCEGGVDVFINIEKQAAMVEWTDGDGVASFESWIDVPESNITNGLTISNVCNTIKPSKIIILGSKITIEI